MCCGEKMDFMEEETWRRESSHFLKPETSPDCPHSTSKCTPLRVSNILMPPDLWITHWAPLSQSLSAPNQLTSNSPSPPKPIPSGFTQSLGSSNRMASAKRPACGHCHLTEGRVAMAPAAPSSAVVGRGAEVGKQVWLDATLAPRPPRNTPSPVEGTGPLAFEQTFPFPLQHLFQAVLAHKVPTLGPLLAFDSMAMLFCPHRCPFQISKFRFSGLFRRGLLLINWFMLDTKEATKKGVAPFLPCIEPTLGSTADHAGSNSGEQSSLAAENASNGSEGWGMQRGDSDIESLDSIRGC